MSNRLFQGVIHQMRDVVDRTIGIVDESGAVISCSDLGRIGEVRNVNTPVVFSSVTPVACDGCLYQAFGTHMRPEYAVFVEGEDSVAQNYIGVLAVSLSSIKQFYDEKYDRSNFIKNIILDNILPGDIYLKARELHFNNEASRVVLLIRLLDKSDVSVYDVVQNLFPDKSKDFVINISENDIALVKEVRSDIDGKDLEKLATLQELDVSYNSLATTSHVAGMVGLKRLDVSSNNLMQVHMKGLDTLTKLEHFAAAYNNLTDLSMLKNCVMLKTLDVSHNTLLNISVVGGLPLLEELDFSYNEVSRLPTFQTTCALRIIRGEHNLLTSLDNLSGLQNLTHIYMDYNTKLTNINALRHCKALNTVNVYGTKVTDISALAAAGILVNYTPKV